MFFTESKKYWVKLYKQQQGMIDRKLLDCCYGLPTRVAHDTAVSLMNNIVQHDWCNVLTRMSYLLIVPDLSGAAASKSFTSLRSRSPSCDPKPDKSTRGGSCLCPI